MKTEKYFTWKEYARVEGEDSPRLLVPRANPDLYEYPWDYIYKSKEEAIQHLKDYGPEDEYEDKETENWVLCKVTVEPVSPAPGY